MAGLGTQESKGREYTAGTAIFERRFGTSNPRPLISRNSTIAGALRFGWRSRTGAMSTSSDRRIVQSWHDQFDRKSNASAGMKER